ncbi:hypothetical protein HSBAA_30680 [Vreelandella sulfidaeris]|uniref:Uncharacterized protein n=1 Tax=Vreelandella sulfidaeris TaxID=115553 RepID=A0A455U6L2_9GAMM|nr:hypothetical protein HSBAA_30680 [Halomonas sulfidaeris]
MVKREAELQQTAIEKLDIRLQGQREQLTRYEEANKQWHVDQKAKAETVKKTPLI